MIYLACDHAGFELMQEVKKYLMKNKIDFESCGADIFDAKDSYVNFAKIANEKVCENESNRGIYICGTGLGICMAANRRVGIRASRCVNKNDVILTRKHNDCNVLVLGGRTLKKFRLKSMLDAFLNTEFEGGRHLSRINELDY